MAGRIKIYEERCVKLQMESEDLRGQMDKLKKRIYDSHLSTSQSTSTTLEALKKDYSDLKERSNKYAKESAEAFENLKKKANEEIKGYKLTIKAKQDEAMAVSMECEELRNKLKVIEDRRSSMHTVGTETIHQQQITLDLPQKKPEEKFDLSMLEPSKYKLDTNKKSKISGILNKPIEKPVPVLPVTEPQQAAPSMKKQAGPTTTSVVTNTEDTDFMDLRNNNCVTRLLEAEGEDFSRQPATHVFSDEILRINSNQERKPRVLLITKYTLYVLIQEGASKFAVKLKAKLNQIFRIEIPKGNSLLVHIKFNEK